MVLLGTPRLLIESPADYVVVPRLSVYEVRIGGCAHVRRVHGNSHGSAFRQREWVVLRVFARPISRLAH